MNDFDGRLRTPWAKPALKEPQSCDRRTGCMIDELQQGKYFLAGCPVMRAIHDTVKLLAPVDVPVLILGETGVGKDVVANLLHKYSLRAQQPFVAVNCAALPSDLLESELFGYEAGAFTGAVKAKPGKFECADRGTVLLDEIGEMSSQMQAKMLHVLQDGQFSRLGARSGSHVDVRVVASTNVNIEDAIAGGKFREDLYYRISTFTLKIPPLRERREEIPYMAAEMMRRMAIKFAKEPVFLSPSLLTVLQEYHWPGNLRELANALVRMEILGDVQFAQRELEDKIRRSREHAVAQGSWLVDQHAHGRVDGMKTAMRSLKGEAERKMIEQSLDAFGWNRRHAAQDLNISYRTLLYKIQQYGLQDSSVGGRRRSTPPAAPLRRTAVC